MFILKKGRFGLRTVSAVGAQWDETVAGDICLSIKKWNLRKNLIKSQYFTNENFEIQQLSLKIP